MKHRVLALLSALAVITYLDRVCISVAGPRMQESLGISPAAWGWVTGMFALSYGAFEIAKRRDGRSPRTASRAHQDRALVVPHSRR